MIERARRARRDGETIDAEDLTAIRADQVPAPLLVESERRTILRTLDQHGWHKDAAARALGISRTTLWRKVRSHRLTPSRFAGES